MKNKTEEVSNEELEEREKLIEKATDEVIIKIKSFHFSKIIFVLLSIALCFVSPTGTIAALLIITLVYTIIARITLVTWIAAYDVLKSLYNPIERFLLLAIPVSLFIVIPQVFITVVSHYYSSQVVWAITYIYFFASFVPSTNLW